LAEARAFPACATDSSSRGDRQKIKRLTGRPGKQAIKEVTPEVNAIFDTVWPVVVAIAQALGR